MFLTLLPSTTDNTTRNAKITLASISFPLLQTGNLESRQVLSLAMLLLVRSGRRQGGDSPC